MSDTERLSIRPGMDSAPLIRRFEITDSGGLSPGLSADAHMVAWHNADATDYKTFTRDTFKVWATFYRSFALQGERGWAIFKQDSHRWEVISMEGSLLRHGTALGDIAANSAGTMTIYYYSSGEVSTGDGISVFNFSNTLIKAGDRLFVWYEPVSKQWYIVGGGGSGGVLVRPTASSIDSGTCCWAGKVQIPPGTPTAFCSNQFTDGATCWITYLDDAIGSAALGTAKLDTSQVYLASPVGSISGVPVYAIGIDKNYVFHVTLAADCAAGSSISVTLPALGAVTATNWSETDYKSGDKVTVYLDETNNQFYMIRGGGSAGFMRFKLYNDMTVADASSPTATVLDFWNIADPGATVTVYNLLSNLGGRYIFHGLANAVGYATYDPKAAKWKILVLEPKARFIEATLTGAFSSHVSTSATVTNYFAGQNPGSTASIYDDQDLFLNVPSGAKIRAVWDDVNGRYRIINADKPRGAGVVYKALLNGALSNASSNATIDTVTTLSGSGTPPSPTTASNYLGWAGADNDKCLIMDDGTGNFILLSVAWDVFTPVKNVFTAATNLLKQTTQAILGKTNAASSDGLIDTGTTC